MIKLKNKYTDGNTIIKDDELDRDIADTLSEADKWYGSPDHMWSMIEPELKKASPWWKRNRMILISATAAISLLLALYISPWVWIMQGDASNNPSSGYEVPNPGIESTQDNSKKEPNQPKRPLISEVSFIKIGLSNTKVKTGESIEVKVNIKSNSDAFKIQGCPAILISSSSTPSGKPIKEFSISSWADLNVIPETPLEFSTSLTAPSLPGEYYIYLELQAGVETIYGGTGNLIVK